MTPDEIREFLTAHGWKVDRFGNCVKSIARTNSDGFNELIRYRFHFKSTVVNYQSEFMPGHWLLIRSAKYPKIRPGKTPGQLVFVK